MTLEYKSVECWHMKLVYTKSHGKTIKAGDLVKIGDNILTRDGDVVKVEYVNGIKQEYYVSVMMLNGLSGKIGIDIQ